MASRHAKGEQVNSYRIDLRGIVGDMASMRDLLDAAKAIVYDHDGDYSALATIAHELRARAGVLADYAAQREADSITAECDECGQSFQLASPYDVQEWSIAHECPAAV